MSSRELKRLNHYPDFRTDNGINDVIQFIANGNLPAGLNARQIARYNEKFGANSGFAVRNNNQNLFYNPNPNINLEVVRPNQRQARIQLVYNDIQRGLGKGLSAFYHQVCMSYLNISKAITDDFLRQQGDYLVGVVPTKKVNKPIITKVPNERWGVDLIDMRSYPTIGNQNRRYILTCVDYFSGKVWARGITNRENNVVQPTLSNAMNDICVNDAHTFPHIIQCDGEFYVGQFNVWCNLNNIQLVRSNPYTPNSNGKVERMNREIRRKMKAYFVRTNSHIWHPRLQAFCNNINNQQNSRNHLTPNQVWIQGYNPHPAAHILPAPQQLNDNMNGNQRRDYNETFIDNRARQLVAQGRTPHIFQVGDLVRIKLLTVSTVMRQQRENNIGWNKAAVHYTPQVFVVVQAFHYPPNFIRNDEYILSNLLGTVLLSGIVPKRFFGSDLILVPPNHVATNVQPETRDRALRINRFA